MPGHAKTLNPRQIAFVQAVVGANGQGMSYSDAAKHAGYKDSPYLKITAAQIAQNPLVKAEIAHQRELVRATLTLTAEHWQRELVYQYQRQRDEKPAGDALRALELWGKHLGLLDTKADSATADASRELLANLVRIMAQQMAKPVIVAPVTVEGRLRALLPPVARESGPEIEPDVA